MDSHLPQPKTCPEVICRNRLQWRQWLSDHHNQFTEAWLVYYKKHTGIKSISYSESVEEAICFGWIDGKKRSIDAQRYTHRFSPRRPNSKWTPLNIKRAETMIKMGLMTEAGLASFSQRQEYDPDFLAQRAKPELELAAEFVTAMKSNRRAWENFNALSPGYRKQYILWLGSAKRSQTREKRLRQAISLLESGQKLGMK